MKKHILRALATGASALCLTITAGAHAQDATPTDPAASDADADNDVIVVTAQRRTERLDKVPIAASVISGNDLDDRAISNVNDLANQSPALSIQNQGALSYVNIRGVGLQTTNPATSSGVAVYSDGFFIPHETTIGDPYFDVAQIEILRGPQGTLVGQSSTGGAIFVNSVRPSMDEVKGYFEGTIGNYDSYRGEGAINLPVSETLAIRAAGHIDSKDSFSTNINPATSSLQPGNMDGFAARLGILWTPSDAVDIYLKGEIGERNGDGFVGKPFGEITGTSLSSIGHPELRDPFTVSYNSPSFDRYKIWRVSGELNWQLSDTVTLRSLTGYQKQRSRLLYDQDYGAVAGQTLVQNFQEDTFQQEFNLISNNDGPFNWVVGAFYLHDKLPVQLINNIGPIIVTIDANPVEKSYAAFAQASYNFSPQWQLQVGFRYNINRKRLTGTQTRQFVGPPIPPFTAPLTGTAKAEEPTGKIALNYYPNDRTTLYISASRGFKAGGTNPIAPLIFEPETINAYEAGLKLNPANGVRLSGAFFYYDYTNMQLSLLSSDPIAAATGQSAITNAPEATIYGGEIEATIKVGDLTLNLGAAYTHSQIDELTAIDARNVPAGPQNLAGRRLAYAPKFTFNAGATYTVPLSFGSLAARVQYSHTSEQYATPFRLTSTTFNPLNGFAGVNDIFDSRDLVDANLTLRFNGGYAVEVFGTNLTDDRYGAGANLGFATIYGAPRQYGVRLSVDF